jgi:hypothetical protein
MRNLEVGQHFLDTSLTKGIKPYSSLESRKLRIHGDLVPPAYVIDGVIPNGVGVIAGSAGVGKTTAIVPLAAIAAGFSSHLSDIKAKRVRHVVVITEDDAQVSRLLVGMAQWLRLDSGQSISISDLSERIHLYSSTRLSISSLKSNLEEAKLFTNCITNKDGKVIEIPPLVIIDTAAANLDINNENANAEISGFMAVLKELHTQTGMNIWVIAHLAKTAKGVDIDNMDSLSARGGGAWEADANWTAILSADEDGKRVLKMNKRRVELLFSEISFSSVVHSKPSVDEFGDLVNVEYRYVTPMRSDFRSRMLQKMKPLEDEVLNLVKTLDYPSKNEIQEELGGKSTKIKNAIDSMLRRKILTLCPLPSSEKKKGRKDYITLNAQPYDPSLT